jgi:hypothetical protein
MTELLKIYQNMMHMFSPSVHYFKTGWKNKKPDWAFDIGTGHS